MQGADEDEEEEKEVVIQQVGYDFDLPIRGRMNRTFNS